MLSCHHLGCTVFVMEIPPRAHRIEELNLAQGKIITTEFLALI